MTLAPLHEIQIYFRANLTSSWPAFNRGPAGEDPVGLEALNAKLDWVFDEYTDGRKLFPVELVERQLCQIIASLKNPGLQAYVYGGIQCRCEISQARWRRNGGLNVRMKFRLDIHGGHVPPPKFLVLMIDETLNDYSKYESLIYQDRDSVVTSPKFRHLLDVEMLVRGLQDAIESAAHRVIDANCQDLHPDEMVPSADAKSSTARAVIESDKATSDLKVLVEGPFATECRQVSHDDTHDDTT
jgi:hypothetical protein